MDECSDPVVESVIEEMRSRSARGVVKYGVTLDQSRAEIAERLQHLKEELLDGALYVEWCLRELA